VAWRIVVITQPARLHYAQQALVIDQGSESVRVPLEDISVLIIDQPQVSLTAQLLSACATAQIAVITVGQNHHPNGVLLPHEPHSRSLKVIKGQLAMSLPRRKRLWQHIIQRKIYNQADVLAAQGHDEACRRLRGIARNVRSGDSGHAESHAAQVYFRQLFGKGFSRSQERLQNAALNYGYSVIRSAIARNLVAYGFITSIGLHHNNETNGFNLADDLLEPFRPIVDSHVLRHFTHEDDQDLDREQKARLISVLHEDVVLHGVETADQPFRCTLLAAAESVVVSLSQRLSDRENQLALPGLAHM